MDTQKGMWTLKIEIRTKCLTNKCTRVHFKYNFWWEVRKVKKEQNTE